jgi:hypothetical protein
MTAEAAKRAARSRRWEQATDWPLMVVAVVFQARVRRANSGRGPPGLACSTCASWLSWITCGIFVVDIVVRLFLAHERLGYLVRIGP